MKLLLSRFRARSTERARREAELRKSDEIRAGILDRVYALDLAEETRPEVSRQREGAIVEVWI